MQLLHYLKQNSIYNLNSDAKGNIFFHRRGGPGYAHLNIQSHKIEPISTIYPKITFPVEVIIFKEKGFIWGIKQQLFTEEGWKDPINPFFQLNTISEEIQEYDLPTLKFRNWKVLQDKHNRIWATNSEHGLLLMAGNKQSYTAFQDQKLLKRWAKAFEISACMKILMPKFG